MNNSENGYGDIATQEIEGKRKWVEREREAKEGRSVVSSSR